LGVARAIRVAGLVAWLIWLVVHLSFLTGFKNRFAAVLNWTVAFLGRGRRQRTISEQRVHARTRALELQRPKAPAALRAPDALTSGDEQ
jgi:NADH:ubiquinone reductase (H+-translocating)